MVSVLKLFKVYEYVLTATESDAAFTHLPIAWPVRRRSLRSFANEIGSDGGLESKMSSPAGDDAVRITNNCMYGCASTIRSHLVCTHQPPRRFKALGSGESDRLGMISTHTRVCAGIAHEHPRVIDFSNVLCRTYPPTCRHVALRP